MAVVAAVGGLECSVVSKIKSALNFWMTSSGGIQEIRKLVWGKYTHSCRLISLFNFLFLSFIWNLARNLVCLLGEKAIDENLMN